MSQKKIAVQDRQTIWDITVREFGSVEGVFLLLADNPSVNIGFANQPVPGVKLKVISEPVNKMIVDYYYSRKIEPASLAFSAQTGGDYNTDYNNDYTNLEVSIIGPGGPGSGF